MSDWINRPLSEIYMAFQEERLTPEALIDEAIARYEKWEPMLKAYKTLSLIHISEPTRPY